MRCFFRSLRSTVGTCGLLLALGCGGANPYSNATLSGQVTLDGQPLSTGTISFLPTSPGQGAAVGAAIENGFYQCDQIPVGRVQVQFAASRDTGQVDEFGVKLHQTLIPPAYQDGISIEVHETDLERNFALITQ